MISHFYTENLHGTHGDTIGYYDANDQKHHIYIYVYHIYQIYHIISFVNQSIENLNTCIFYVSIRFISYSYKQFIIYYIYACIYMCVFACLRILHRERALLISSPNLELRELKPF